MTVNGQPAQMFSIAGTPDWLFQREIDVTEGTNTVSIVATDESSNVSTESYEFEVTSEQTTLDYDDNGNLVEDGGRTFTWDAKNQLLSVTVGGTEYAWSYDSAGRRIEEKVDSVVTRQWIWNGMRIIQERDGSGNVVKSLYGFGHTTPTEEFVYTFDHLGSIREAVDASGALRAVYEYAVWGQRTKISGNIDLDRGVTGHFHSEGTGLILAPFRGYDPELGRWLSRDPLGEFADGPNLYSYVLNNPVNLWDPLGLETLILIHRNAPQKGQPARNAWGTMSVIHDGVFQFSTPVNRFGYQEGTNGIYPGTYSVRPRTDAVEKSRFPNGTPAVTAPGQSNPGNAGNGFRNVYIHAEADLAGGDSRGCPTVSADAAQKIKEFMDADQKRGHNTTLKIFNYGGAPYATPR